MSDLQRETTEVLAHLVRLDTVNPPGNERAAIEYLEAYVREAGFETRLLALEEQRPNLVATLEGEAEGPVLALLGHVDTVLAAPEEWAHDPWSGDLEDGFLWGRGSLDMKSQVAASAVAAVSLARSGWRPARGALRLIFVCDEETGGELGARWLTEEHPDAVRCDYLLNEGAGGLLELGGQRYYGVCCGEKGVFRIRLSARGTAGHASMPRMGSNALLKLAPALAALAGGQPPYDLTEPVRLMLTELGLDPDDPNGSIERLAREAPALTVMIEPMLGVTLTPTMAEASRKINVIPSQAALKIDCRVPPGLGEEVATARLHQVLGDAGEGLDVQYTERVPGHLSPARSPLRDAIERWVSRTDPGARTLPCLLPGYSDSSWFRAAFPELIAYGFFPQRHQPLLESAPLVHSANERIDVRDLGLATDCYADIARELLG
jgi:acetylornithine deacetylase/succinyl-diaminopimelate desuccinylase-like protein